MILLILLLPWFYYWSNSVFLRAYYLRFLCAGMRFYFESICMCFTKHLYRSCSTFRLGHCIGWHCAFFWNSSQVLLGRTVEIPHLTLCCVCRPTICGYCRGTSHCLPHEGSVGPRRPRAPVVAETRCSDVMAWRRVAAVDDIGEKIIMIAMFAPPPPPAARG